MGAACDEAEALKQMEHVFDAHGIIEYSGRDAWNRAKVKALETVRGELGGRVGSVLDFGPGSMCPLRAWDYFPQVVLYTGVEGSAKIMARQIELFPNREFINARFGEWLQQNAIAQPASYDLVLALDMLYHIPEDDVHDRLLERLFEARRAVILTYSPVEQDFGGQKVGQGGFAWFPRPRVADRVVWATRSGWRLVDAATFTGGPQKQLLAALVRE